MQPGGIEIRPIGIETQFGSMKNSLGVIEIEPLFTMVWLPWLRKVLVVITKFKSRGRGSTVFTMVSLARRCEITVVGFVFKPRAN